MSEPDTASRQLALALCWLLLLSAVGSVAPIGSATAAGNTCTDITAGNTIDSQGCYVLNATNTSVTTSAAVEISANNVTLHGGGNTLAAGSSTAEAGVLATPGGEGRITNLTVRNLTVRGFNRSGLVTLSGSNITVENVTATGQVGPNSYGINLLSVTGAQISGVTAGRNGEDGVRVSGGSGITVTNTTLLNNNQSGFDAENSAEDILVRDTNASLTNQSTAEGFELGNSLANVTLENVTAVKNNGTGVVVFGNSSGVTLVESRAAHNRVDGVRVQNTTQVEVRSTELVANRDDGLDVFDRSSAVTVRDSLVSRNGDIGVLTDRVSGFAATRSELINNSDAGFRAFDSQDIVVRDTNASLQTANLSSNDTRVRDGVGFSNVTDGLIKNLTAVGNTDAGVNIYDRSENITVSGSDLTDNGDGLRANESRDITVRNTNTSLNTVDGFSDGVGFVNTTDGVVKNVTAVGNDRAGVVLLDGTSNIAVSESRLINNNISGLNLVNSRNIAIEDTNASLNSGGNASDGISDGIKFINATGSSAENITAIGNGQAGIGIFAGSANISVSKSRLVANNQAGIVALDSTNVSVRGVNASLNTEASPASGVVLINTTEGAIRDATAVGNNGTGVSLSAGTADVTVSGGRLISNRRAGLLALDSRNITVLSTNASLSTGPESSGVNLTNVTDSSLDSLTAVRNNDTGVRLTSGSDNVTVSGGQFIANKQGVDVRNSSDIAVQNTDITDSTGTAGVNISESRGVGVQTSDVRESRGDGVRIFESQEVTVSTTDVRNSRLRGIGVFDSQGLKISRSGIKDSRTSGILIENSSNATVTDVTAQDNGDSGITLAATANVTVNDSVLNDNANGISLGTSRREPTVGYNLTVINSSGSVVGSATVEDRFDVSEYGNRVSFGAVGDTASDNDRGIIDYLRLESGEVIENWESRDLDNYTRTAQGGGGFDIVDSPTADGNSALRVSSGCCGDRITSNDELIELNPGTTIRAGLRHQTDNSDTYAHKTTLAVGSDRNGNGGISMRLINPGRERTAGAEIITPNERGRIEFVPNLREFYTFRLDIGKSSLRTENNTITNVTATNNTVAFTVGGEDVPVRNNTVSGLQVGDETISGVDARLFNISERAELPRPIPENWTPTGVQFDISAQQGAANGGGFVDLTVDISGEVDEIDPSSLDLWRYKLDEERWVRTNAEIDVDAGTVSQRFNGSCCSPVALLRNETSDSDGGGGGNDGGDGGGSDSIQVSDPIGPGEVDDQSESDGGPPLNLSTASTEFDEVRTSGSENTTLTLTNNGSRTVTVERVETTEPAFTPTQGRFTLDPGESETVLVRFEPDGPGTYNGSVRFETASRTLSASLTGVSLGDTSADVNVSTTLSPDRRVVEVTVTNPVPGDPVEIPLPGDRLERAEISAAFENLSLTPNVSEDFELRVVTSPAPLSTTPAFGPRATNGTVPLTFANITKTITDAELQTVTVRARVSKARLAELGARPETVVLFRYEGNRWVPKPTSVVAETDRTVVVAATAAGLSEWTAAARRPQFNITDAVIDIRAPTVEDTVTIQTFIENTGGADGLYNAELLVNGSVVDQRRTSIPPGGTAQLNFRQLFEAPQTYEVRVNNFTVGAVTVNPQPDSGAAETATPTPSSEVSGLAPVAIGAMVALLVGVVLLARVYRQRR